MASSVGQMLQQAQQKFAAYRAALEERDRLLRDAYTEIRGLKAELEQWEAAVRERDELLRTAYAEIKERDAALKAFEDQAARASQRIADIGGPAYPPEVSEVPVADEAAEKTPAGPPAPPAREP